VESGGVDEELEFSHNRKSVPVLLLSVILC